MYLERNRYRRISNIIFELDLCTKSLALFVLLIFYFVMVSKAGAFNQETELANGQNGFSETVAQAWQIAIKNNSAVKSQRSAAEATSFAIKGQKAYRHPSLSLSTQYRRLEETVVIPVTLPGQLFSLPQLPPAPDRMVDIETNEEFSMAQLELSLPIYTGGQISRGIEISEINHQLETTKLQLQIDSIKLKAAEAFIQVLRSERARTISHDHVLALESHVADVRSLYQKGLVANNDLLSAELALTEGKQRELIAQNILALRSSHYNQVLGRKLSTQFFLEEPFYTILLDELDIYSGKARGNRLELKALQLQHQMLNKQIGVYKSEKLPKVQATVMSMYNDADITEDENINSIGVAMRWQIFGAQHNRHHIAQLSNQIESLEFNKEHTESLIELEVQQSWLAVKESQQREKVMETALVAAEENLRVTRNRYKNGVGTNSDVLDAELARNMSISNYYNARYDITLSYYRLLAAAGELSDNAIQ